MNSRVRSATFCCSIALLAAAGACRQSGEESATHLGPATRDYGRGITPASRDLSEIARRDTLVVLTRYSSTSYFVYKGEPMGYEFEALRAFARSRNLTLQFVVAFDRDTLFNMLNRGDGDLVAARLVPAPDDSGRVAFTAPLYTTPPALVQRASGSPTAPRITDPKGLARQTVYLTSKSPAEHLVLEVTDSASGAVRLVEVDSTSEALIKDVSKGTIAYTVADSNVGAITSAVFPTVVVSPVLGAPRPVAWAVRRTSPQLRAALDEWIQANQTLLSGPLYSRYFEDERGYRERLASPYLTSETGHLSQYDNILQRYASSINWDWRLLASQAYQESRFRPTAKSWVGAVGLLQLMPSTAKGLGVRNRTDPEQNVRGAVKFLADLTRYWTDKVPDATERLKFVLASYNAGIGHVADAQRLATKHGGNAQRWKDVAYWLQQAARPEVNRDPVVRYGYVRGDEPVKYVSVIFDRWQHYRQAPRTGTARTESTGEVVPPIGTEAASAPPPPTVSATPASPPVPTAAPASKSKPGNVLRRSGSGRLLTRKQRERQAPSRSPGGTRGRPSPRPRKVEPKIVVPKLVLPTIP